MRSLNFNETFRTNKKQYLQDHSSVSDTLKQHSSEYKPVEFIDHATRLTVDIDLNEFPSLDAETQRNISINFRKLHQKVRDNGLHVCSISNYGMEVVRYLTLFSLFIYTLRCEWYITSAVFLGLFWHQIMFVAHDAGHLAITHSFNLDTMIGIFIADFCCGLSIGWWKSSHNVHHLVPNHPVCIPSCSWIYGSSTSLTNNAGTRP
jgi:sphingolipid 8-(E)-desaturase